MSIERHLRIQRTHIESGECYHCPQRAVVRVVIQDPLNYTSVKICRSCAHRMAKKLVDLSGPNLGYDLPKEREKTT